MRCYLHLVNGQESILDETVLEISDIEEAHTHALQALQELMEMRWIMDEDWLHWRLNVVDEASEVLLSLSLDKPLPELQLNWSSAAAGLWYFPTLQHS
jgi:hypothetical protein